MNEIKRYDQALADQLEHLPMPPEDIAWAEMNKMLEEDDDDPVVVPFFRRPGCLLPGLVAAVLLLIGGWLYFKRDAAPVPVSEQLPAGNKANLPGPGNDSSTTGIHGNHAVDTSVTIDTIKDLATTNVSQTIGSDSVQPSSSFSSGGQTTNESTGEGPVQTRTVKGRTAIKVTPSVTGSDEGRPVRVVKKKAGYSAAGPKTKATVVSPGTGEDENTTSPTANENEPVKEPVTVPAKVKMTLQPGVVDSSVTKKNISDSTTIVKKDSLPKKTNTVQQPGKEEDPKKNQWQLAAGLSVYQPLPLSGEPIVPYNYYGRKGSLTDYIPAAHIRLYRTKKWFAHLEFRYGAPQSVKPFDYKQQIRDSAQTVFRTVYQLQKTYYHQLPFSFNYYILPGLSVGGGIIYNHFTGAVAKKDVYKRSAIQDTLLSSSIIRDTAANKVIKDHFQWSAEMQYQWKRLSIGARFSADINPYIKFTDITTGAEVEKKMKALNVFLRFDLWRSKKWGK